jgi:hypothetical protein
MVPATGYFRSQRIAQSTVWAQLLFSFIHIHHCICWGVVAGLQVPALSWGHKHSFSITTTISGVMSGDPMLVT